MRGATPREGLFGGSFNPPHIGHLAMIERAKEGLGLDRVVVIPAGRPPHKLDRDDGVDGLADARDRLAMARLAFAEVADISDEEVRKSTPSFTFETLEAHRARLGPAARLFWILGTDSVRDLPGWRHHHRILELCDIASIPRRGAAIELVDDPELEFTARERQRLRRYYLGGPTVDVSSSEIRRKLSRGDSVERWVPHAVLDYIVTHGLFGAR